MTKSSTNKVEQVLIQREEHNVAEFMIPQDVTGIVNLNFNNLDNNDLAKQLFQL